MPEKHLVSLSTEERSQLLSIIEKGHTSGRKFRRAHMLLLTDEGYNDETIAQMLHVGLSTVRRTRKKFVEGNLDLALSERPRCGGKRKLDGKAEAFLVATACSNPPEGRQGWTMQLLADRLVQLNIVEEVSDETVRRLMKKTTLSLGSKNNGASPQ